MKNYSTKRHIFCGFYLIQLEYYCFSLFWGQNIVSNGAVKKLGAEENIGRIFVTHFCDM